MSSARPGAFEGGELAEGASPGDPLDHFDQIDEIDELEEFVELDALDPLDQDTLEEEGGRSQVDELLDELVPPDLDWRRIVRSYPIPSLLVAGAAGYWLGSSKKGAAIAEALASAVALGVTKQLVDVDLEEFEE